LLRLLPMSDREKDIGILALRHQITVLERQLNGQKVHFHAIDRALLASLLPGLPQEALRRMRLLVRPDTVLRWHRDPVARRSGATAPGSVRRQFPAAGVCEQTQGLPAAPGVPFLAPGAESPHQPRRWGLSCRET
jgi:hypothetical protein